MLIYPNGMITEAFLSIVALVTKFWVKYAEHTNKTIAKKKLGVIVPLKEIGEKFWTTGVMTVWQT